MNQWFMIGSVVVVVALYYIVVLITRSYSDTADHLNTLSEQFVPPEVNLDDLYTEKPKRKVKRNDL